MPVLEVIQVDTGFSGTEASDERIQKLIQAITKENLSVHFVLGTGCQDKNVVQVIFQRQDDTSSTANEPVSESSSFAKAIGSIYDAPLNTFHVNLDHSVFGTAGPATPKVVEYVLSYFPISRIHPEFQKQVEEDFIKFDEIYSPAAIGNHGWISGWVEEEQHHPDNNGELAKCFFVMRGWDSMGHFESSVKSEAYQKAVPLLLAWNAPWKMVSMLCFLA